MTESLMISVLGEIFPYFFNIKLAHAAENDVFIYDVSDFHFTPDCGFVRLKGDGDVVRAV